MNNKTRFVLYGGGTQTQRIDESLKTYLSSLDPIGTITFIPNAKQNIAKRKMMIAWFKEHWKNNPVHILDLEETSKEEIAETIKKSHCLYFGGGDTFFLNNILSISDIKQLLTERMDSPLLLAGFSAGAIVMGASIMGALSVDEPSKDSDVEHGLEILPYNIMVHYDPERKKDRDTLKKMMNMRKEPIICLPENTGINIKSGVIQVISEGPKIEVYLPSGLKEKYGNNTTFKLF